jgi:hypothetical protein
MSKHLVVFLALASCAPMSRSLPASSRTAANAAESSNEPRLIATLDQAIGPKFTDDQERFTATIVSGSALATGTKLVGRVIEVQAAMAGTMAYAVLTVNGIQTDDGVKYFDGRIAGVELFQNQPGGREVNATGATDGEVVGAVIQPSKIPQTGALDRDPLGRGTVISLGTGAENHQLDKGTRIVIVAGPSAPGLPKLIASADIGGKDFVVGGTVKLDNVLVESVVGDVVFWAGNSTAERTLVVLDLVIDEPEKRTIVEKGMHLTITGTIEPMPSTAEAPRLWKMVSSREASAMGGHATYIHATKVTHNN